MVRPFSLTAAVVHRRLKCSVVKRGNFCLLVSHETLLLRVLVSFIMLFSCAFRYSLCARLSLILK